MRLKLLWVVETLSLGSGFCIYLFPHTDTTLADVDADAAVVGAVVVGTAAADVVVAGMSVADVVAAGTAVAP